MSDRKLAGTLSFGKSNTKVKRNRKCHVTFHRLYRLSQTELDALNGKSNAHKVFMSKGSQVPFHFCHMGHLFTFKVWVVASFSYRKRASMLSTVNQMHNIEINHVALYLLPLNHLCTFNVKLSPLVWVTADVRFVDTLIGLSRELSSSQNKL